MSMNDKSLPQSGESGGGKKRVGRLSKIRELIQTLHANYDFRLNIHTRDIYIKSKHLQTATWQICDNITFNDLYIELHDQGMPVSERNINKVVYSSHTRLYDPIKDYLEGLPERGGTSAIRKLCESVELTRGNEQIDLGDGQYITVKAAFEVLMKRWLIAAVACGLGRNPNHVCLTLIGGQRRYKTTWLNALCPLPDYRFVGHIVPSMSQGETPNLMAEKWFINIDDQLEVIFRKDFNSLKSIITIDEVTNRKPYMPRSERRKRIANFMASVNSTEFLVDEENRRYMCIEVDMCHVSKMPSIDAVWAEAYSLYKAGEQFWFKSEEYMLINYLNQQYGEVSQEQEWLQICFRPAKNTEIPALKDQKRGMTASEILKHLSAKAATNNLRLRGVGLALAKLKFPKGTQRYEGAPRKVYYVVERAIESTPVVRYEAQF